MSNTTFVNQFTVVVADWLNDVNDTVYEALGNGTNAPNTPAEVKTNLDLDNVDNTSDLDKPISTATQAAITDLSDSTTESLALKADLTTTTPRTSTTGSSLLPSGTTEQRDSTPTGGYIRLNTDTSKFEGYNGTAWTSVGGGATGGGSDEVFIENGQTVNVSYAIPSGKNAGTFGPVSVASGVTVTIPTGSVWTIV